VTARIAAAFLLGRRLTGPEAGATIDCDEIRTRKCCRLMATPFLALNINLEATDWFPE
jgi:hypothetical protein